MNTLTGQLTSRRALDRTFWHALRCAMGWHVKANWELREFTRTEKRGRTKTEYTVWANVRETICCGKSEIEVL